MKTDQSSIDSYNHYMNGFREWFNLPNIKIGTKTHIIPKKENKNYLKK